MNRNPILIFALLMIFAFGFQAVLESSVFAQTANEDGQKLSVLAFLGGK